MKFETRSWALYPRVSFGATQGVTQFACRHYLFSYSVNRGGLLGTIPPLADVMPGTLFIVATPIGNLEDISARALTTLKTVSVVAAEDTRYSARLMRHFGIETPLLPCHDHNEREQSYSLLTRLQGGEDVALVSDAGTPLISDPGYRLVHLARQQNIKVVPIPGCCAFVAALCAAGLPSDRFAFEGFLPARASARRGRLQRLKGDERTLIFYEAPHRLLESLHDLADVFGVERQAALARELTKTFETIHSAPLAELRDWVAGDVNQQRGEVVLLVGGYPPVPVDEVGTEGHRVLALLLDELPVKQAAALAARITGLRRNTLYQEALRLSREAGLNQ